MSAQNRGFTLVELLVVISIIAILSVIGITVFTGVQKGARNTKRISDMRAIVLALEQYYNNPVNNFQYPNPGGGWRSECNAWGGYTSDQVIPGLAPNYLASFPSDPRMDKTNSTSCYLYQSNGTDYTLLDHNIEEFINSRSDYVGYKPFIDPTRDGGPDGCAVDYNPSSPNIWSWKRSSPGGRCW